MSKYIIEFSQKKLRALIDDEQSCVKLHKRVLSLALYPYHLSDISSSIKDLLNAKFASYDKKLGGLFLGYKNVKILTPQGSIVTDSYYIHINIEADFYIFQPTIDSILCGIVNKISGDHVGCLVHQVFNVSAPNLGDKTDWLGFDVNLGDHVLLRVYMLDMDSRLPYIRATLISNKSKEKNNDVVINTKSEFSDNIDINISGIREIESKSIEKKKRKSKKHSLDTINVIDQSLNETTQSINNEIPTNKKIKKSKRKLAETNYNLVMNQTLNLNTEIANLDTSIETKYKKIKKSSTIADNFDKNAHFKSDVLNNETPKENKSKKSKKSSESNNTLEKDLILNSTTEALRHETSTEKKRKKSKKSLERTENVDKNETSHSTSQIINNVTERNDKKSHKSFETSSYADKIQKLSSASQILNEIPKEGKVKKSRKSIEASNNIKNLNLSSTSEILNGETPKDKKSNKSRKSLVIHDNYDNNQNTNPANINNEITPKNKLNHNKNDVNFNLDSEQKSSKKSKKHKDRSELANTSKINELYQVDNCKEKLDKNILSNSLLAEQSATIQTGTFETPKQLKKSKKRNSITHLESENVNLIATDDKNRKSDQQNLWNNIVLQMYDSELERTLDKSRKSQKSNITNNSENTETPKNSKRRHSFSDLEVLGNKKRKHKHSISEFQDTDESPKKKHKSKKKIRE